jgi:hypothetical protein
VVSQTSGHWGTAIEVPGLAALNTGGNAAVDSVSCASAGNCSAGGTYFVRSSHTDTRHGFVVSQTNGHWGTAIKVPGLGTLSPGGETAVGSVSCASAGNCSAVGTYQDPSNAFHHQGFVVSQTSGRWGKAIEVPGLAALNTGGTVTLNQVSCASAGNCSAGGTYLEISNPVQGFVVSQSNGRWGKAFEVPGLGALNADRDAEGISVSCASAGNCSAGGSYTDSSDARQGFVLSQSNGVWGTAIEVPGLGALNTGGSAGVGPLSCAAAGRCSAGGSYSESLIKNEGFVVSEN